MGSLITNTDAISYIKGNKALYGLKVVDDINYNNSPLPKHNTFTFIQNTQNDPGYLEW